MSRTATRRTLLAAGGVVVIAPILAVWAAPDLSRRALRSARARIGAYLPEGPPSVEWETVAPAEAGLDGARLDVLWAELETRGTRSFLVVRGDRLAYERYGNGHSANRRHSAAAATKALVASPIIAAMLDDGRIDLEARAIDYLPVWQDDPIRSRITLHQLGSHTSGLQDVDFDLERSGIPDWERDYVVQEGSRFSYAFERAEMLSEPGEAYSYSGTAFYPLAYALTRALQGSSATDIYTLYRDRVMRPLEVPDDAWQISYGDAYDIDGMKLYAAGSGGSFTGRAAARIGALMLGNGAWKGHTVLGAASVDAVTAPIAHIATPPDLNGSPAFRTGVGWYLNLDGFLPSLPADAMMAVGGGQQLVVVVPSRDLVVVRQGRPLVDGPPGKDRWLRIDAALFQPLMAALTDAPGAGGQIAGPAPSAEAADAPAAAPATTASPTRTSAPATGWLYREHPVTHHPARRE